MSWLLRSLVDATVAWGAALERSDPDTANRLFDRRCRLLSRLRRSPEERAVLDAMIAGADPWCRLTGATFLWKHDQAKALETVDGLTGHGAWQLRVNAEQVAIQMRAGTLDTSHVDRCVPADPPSEDATAE